MLVAEKAFWCISSMLILSGSVLLVDMSTCALKVYFSRAMQTDSYGLKCWDFVKVAACGGRCDSREISDWEFPFKKSHHPVCVFGKRKPLVVKLRHCDDGVMPGTEIFHFVAAEDCRCKVCSSQHTSCDWLPPNSTLLEGINDENLEADNIDEDDII